MTKLTAVKQKAKYEAMVKLLRKTRTYMKTGQEIFLCFAVVEAGCRRGYYADPDIIHACRKYIMDRLKGATTYETWVKRNHPAISQEMEKRFLGLVNGGAFGRYVVKRSPYTKGRIQWLTAIINRLENEIAKI